jgi:hypothetical protein
MVKFNIKVEFNEQAKSVTADAKIEAYEVHPEEYGNVMAMIMKDNEALFNWAYSKSKAWSMSK